MLSYHRILLPTLLSLFLLEFAFLAIAPSDRQAWILENLLVFLVIPALALSYRYFPLSRLSYIFIFLFLSLHEVGAHYTYANVPYNDWFQSMFGVTLNELLGWQRNNFDRIVHFLYGLLLAYPIREVFVRIVNVRGFWGYFLPLDLTMSSSMMFELLEWWVAVLFGGDLGAMYLGTQGDVWDAHKDMALASLGAAITMSIVAWINSQFQRDFAQEWADSFRVKKLQPLGGDEDEF